MLSHTARQPAADTRQRDSSGPTALTYIDLIKLVYDVIVDSAIQGAFVDPKPVFFPFFLVMRAQFLRSTCNETLEVL